LTNKALKYCYPFKNDNGALIRGFSDVAGREVIIEMYVLVTICICRKIIKITAAHIRVSSQSTWAHRCAFRQGYFWYCLQQPDSLTEACNFKAAFTVLNIARSVNVSRHL